MLSLRIGFDEGAAATMAGAELMAAGFVAELEPMQSMLVIYSPV